MPTIRDGFVVGDETPPVEATNGEWRVLRGSRVSTAPPRLPGQEVEWTLLLAHAEDGHEEGVTAWAPQGMTYRRGQAIWGEVRNGRLIRHRRPTGQGRA